MSILNRGKTLALVLTIASSIALAIPAIGLAQERQIRNPDAVIVNPQVLRGTGGTWLVRGEGKAAPARTQVTPDPPPPELTTAQKTALVAGIGAINSSLGPWRVTPGQPVSTGRAWLYYSDVVNMATHADPQYTYGNVSSYAAFSPSEPNEGVWLSFLPPAPGRYLVDCRVKKNPASVPYEVTVYPGEAQQTFANTAHLVLVYEAVDLSPAHFDIEATGQGFTWGFYGCEITPLQ